MNEASIVWGVDISALFVEGQSHMMVLESLIEQGLIKADSFKPVEKKIGKKLYEEIRPDIVEFARTKECAKKIFPEDDQTIEDREYMKRFFRAYITHLDEEKAGRLIGMLATRLDTVARENNNPITSRDYRKLLAAYLVGCIAMNEANIEFVRGVKFKGPYGRVVGDKK